MVDSRSISSAASLVVARSIARNRSTMSVILTFLSTNGGFSEPPHLITPGIPALPPANGCHAPASMMPPVVTILVTVLVRSPVPDIVTNMPDRGARGSRVETTG